jgi:type III secretion protein U
LLGVYQPATETALSGAHLLFVMFAAAAVFWVAISALDYGIQYFSFMREQRMSFEDIKREHKDMEGDPHVKAQRRALQQEMAQKAAARSVKGARALIANPTHVSVAIAFTSVETGLPYVLAKGLDAQALAMRAEAEQLGIPIFEDVPLARALHRKLELDAVITQEFYAPIARVIVWVQQLAESDLDQPDNPTHTDRITH